MHHHHLHPTIGVEIGDLDLTEPISEADAEEVRALFDEHCLLLFRGQELTVEQQRDIVSVIDTPSDEMEDGAGFTLVSNRGGIFPDGDYAFHYDFAATPHPARLISLYGLEVHDDVAPTLFVNCTLDQDWLPEALFSRLADRTAILTTRFSDIGRNPALEDLDLGAVDDVIRTRREVIGPHPRTGRPVVQINQQMTHHIDGLSHADSQALFQQVWTTMYAADRVYHHEWQPSDLVIWDNRAVQHGRTHVDGSSDPRILRRVACADISFLQYRDTPVDLAIA